MRYDGTRNKMAWVARRSTTLAMPHAISKVVGIFALGVILRKLGLTEYGTYAYSYASARLIFGLADLRAYEAIMRFYDGESAGDGERPRAGVLTFCLRLDFYSGAAALLATGLLAIVVGFLWDGGPSPFPLLLCGGSLFFLTLNETAATLMKLQDRYGLLSRLQVFQTLLDRTVAVAGAVLFGSAVGLALALALSSLVSGASFVYFAHRLLQVSDGSRYWTAEPPARETQKAIARFMFGTSIFASAKQLGGEVEVALMGVFGSADAVAVYRVAQAGSMAVGSIVYPLQQVAYPRFATARRDGTLRDDVRTTQFLTLGVLVPATALAAVFAPSLVRLLGGDIPADEAAEAMRVLLLGVLLMSGTFWTGYVLILSGRLTALNIAQGIRVLTFAAGISAVAAFSSVSPTAVAWCVLLSRAPIVLLQFQLARRTINDSEARSPLANSNRKVF